MLDEFADQVIARIRAARRALQEASGSPDSFAIQETLDELEDALRCARDGGIEVPPAGGDDEAMRG